MGHDLIPGVSLEGILRAETMLALSDLLGGVLHEINNPLATVLGQAHLLKESKVAGPDHVGLDRLSRAAERMASVSRGFALLAREESPPVAAISLSSEVEQALPFLAYALAVRRLALETSLAPTSLMLRGRSRDLRLLVVALVAPALQSLGTGIAKTIRVATSRSHPGWARLEVSSPDHSIEASLEPRILREAASSGPPSVYLADRLSRVLGGSLNVQDGILSADLPALTPAH